MDFREVPINECPIKYLDTLHLILFILYKRTEFCKNLGLNCMDLPVLATSPLVARNCDRNDVHKFFKRMRRIVERIGNEIEIFRFGRLSASLLLEFGTGSIRVHDNLIVSDNDCNKVQCVTVNNVTTFYMRLIIRLSDKNLVVLNVPDIIMWLARVYGLDTVYSALNLVHSYVENGSFSDDLDRVLEIISKWGVNLDRDSFINATLPGRRNLLVLREILNNAT
ncbi:hypothetical protein [Vulcanisaeta distributa]|uniref:Uncharacterized protein n=1 Tax=Vulcanisaeta distributa (strain DSM 14429 / JCM 11212 / NBRC 100878 / IC-017) TaxID=572478 RepID=E1QU18_VULDI|nr:hypothetical protein [Vulcanisaeta distributa]ADN49815.1 conserved hypothetical protein [Vulcanisaeta distributa DSM 14429]